VVRQALPQGAEKTQRVRAMFDAIAPRYEFVNHLMTFGLDRRWRRRAVSDLRLPPNSTVLDIAAGTGDFCREARRQGLRPIATDLSIGMLEAGGSFAPRVQADASSLPFETAVFDGVTCGYALRNFTELEASLQEMARVLRPGGRLSILEVAEPRNVFWRLGFTFWFRGVVPIIGAILSDRAAYRYLPKSTAYLPPTEELRAMLVRSGFSGVNHRLVVGGLSQQFLATRAL
jgi:demethylmenaquinone methyltransferase / 2-methoxy-6-polyprenyl-1,4-benzoquinol methylase